MKLAIIEKIIEIEPIPNSDYIELAKIQGWRSVVKKNEYKVGDTIIFIPIDTMMQPREWNKFFWNKEDPTKPIITRTSKLRGVISQGLIFPLAILGENVSVNLGDDVSSILEIVKYEKPVPAQIAGDVVGNFPTHIISKTDEDNLLSNIGVLNELKSCDYVEVSMKIDGTSCTFIKDIDGNFRVCMRNLELKEQPTTFWKIAYRYNLKDLMPVGTVLQGEVYGNGINKNRLNIKTQDILIFNKKNLFTHEYEDLTDLFHPDLKRVPIIETISGDKLANLSADYLQDLSNKQKYNNTPAEGIVIRGFKNGKLAKSEILFKMLSVKVINQNYKD